MAGKKPTSSANKAPRRTRAQRCCKAKAPDVGDAKTCAGRGRIVDPAVFDESTPPNHRYGALPKIVEDVVQSCESLPEISHLDSGTLPESDVVVRILNVAREIFFPGYFGDKTVAEDNLAYHIGDRMHELYLKLSTQIYRSARHECCRTDAECSHCKRVAEHDAQQVLRRIPEIRRLLELDVKAAYDGDPAARGYPEIILSYPGLLAVSVYRLAHELWELSVSLLPRMMTEFAHTETGIDIHPGAQIGESFFIDHGTGVVIGETSVIGNRVKIYQGVTLGALSFPKDGCGQIIRGQKRHPTIEDDVTIYAQATILGGNTVVGAGSTIGGNVWLTDSVPANSLVTGKKPEPVIRQMKRKS